MASKLLAKVRAYARVLPRAKRNRSDLTRLLVRRPAIGLAVGGYETALLVSSSLENRYKMLAGLKVASLIGCPF